MRGDDERTVLHVLPHPGGGGETYVDLLSRMEGYRFERIYLASSTRPVDALRRLPRSVVSLLRRADLIHVEGEVASAICVPFIAARPSIITLNGLHLLRRATGMKRRIAEANLRLIVRTANRTICVSNAERAAALEVVGARAAGRLLMIHNSVDLPELLSSEQRAALRAELGLAPSSVVGVFAGALVAHKDPLVAARAAKEVARGGGDLVLLIAGDGPLRPALERIAREDGASAIRVLGHRADLPRLFAAADFFVLPSHREGLSFALLEAMATGLAPVVSDAPGNPEAIGEAGIVVADGNFAIAYRQLLDEAVRRRLGAEARDRVRTHFHAEEMVSRTRAVYDALEAPHCGLLLRSP